MAPTTLRPSIRFDLFFLMIICARLVTGDYTHLLSRLHELSSKNRHPLLLFLDHTDLEANHHHNSNAYNSLERREEDALSQLLSGLNPNRVLSNRYPLLQDKYHQHHNHKAEKRYSDNEYNDHPLQRETDRKKRYQLDHENHQQDRYNDRQDRHRAHQDRNRNQRNRYRNKQGRYRNQLNRHRTQQDRYGHLQDQYQQNQDVDQLDYYKNILNKYHKERHREYKNRNDRADSSQSHLHREEERDTSKYSAENEALYALKRYGERERDHRRPEHRDERSRKDRNRKSKYYAQLRTGDDDREGVYRDRHDDDSRDRYRQDQDRQERGRQVHHERREQDQGLRSPSPVIRTLLRMSNSLRCGARDRCQDECANEKEVDDCEDICEEKFVCEESEEDPCEKNNSCELTGSTKGVLIEHEEPKCKRCY